MLAGGAAGADAQHAAAGRLVRREHALRFVHLLQYLPRVVQEQLARRRGPNTLPGAYEQLDAQHALLRADLLADRRLTETEATPGTGEAVQIDDGHERAQQFGVELLLAAFEDVRRSRAGGAAVTGGGRTSERHLYRLAVEGRSRIRRVNPRHPAG